jgi:hypothetical protein
MDPIAAFLGREGWAVHGPLTIYIILAKKVWASTYNII